MKCRIRTFDTKISLFLCPDDIPSCSNKDDGAYHIQHTLAYNKHINCLISYCDPGAEHN